MADDKNNNAEQSGLNRRNFLKSAGVVVAGGTLGASLTFPAEKAAAVVDPAQTTLTVFRCPIDSKEFRTFAELKNHFAAAHPNAVTPVTTKLKVNGKDYEVLIEPQWTLQRTLQFKLGLTGAKQMCDRGVCGSCTVIIDGRAVLSCTTLAVECEGKSIQTVEGIAADPKWRPLINPIASGMPCSAATARLVLLSRPRLFWKRIRTRVRMTASRHWPATSAAAAPIRATRPQSWRQHR